MKYSASIGKVIERELARLAREYTFTVFEELVDVAENRTVTARLSPPA